MDYVFSAGELSAMQDHQENHMMDTCAIQAVSVSGDTFGQQVESWPVDGDDLSCGLDMRPGSERREPDKTILEYDATIRLPLGTTIDVRDRIKVTERFGETLDTPLVYEIIGPVQQGPSGIRLLLKRTET